MEIPVSAPLDVVVVGAGFAGLAATQALEAAGCRTALLEALERPGGRAETVIGADGSAWDAGAQFINGDMRRVLGLARRFGLGLVAAPVGGRSAVHAPGAGHAQVRLALAEAEAFEAAVIAGAGRVDDAASLADLVGAERLSPLGRSVIRSAIAELCCAAPEDVSAAWAAEGDARYGSDRDDVEFFLREGFGGLAAALAASLRSAPRLGTPVLGLGEGTGTVQVHTPRGTLVAAAVVLAVPMARAARLAPPSLPAEARAALAGFREGAVIKLALRYAEPFWRYGGFAGNLRSAALPGLWFGDTSTGEGGTLTALAGGPLARELAALPAEARISRIAAAAAEGFGVAAPPLLSCDERLWLDHPTLGGGYSGHRAAGAPSGAEAALTRLDGPIVFAGTDLAADFPGFVEGAIASGEAAAARVLGKLGGAPRARQGALLAA
ncbi:FAD-dependent oxidoreductase [Elioraea sp.]|uniref:flavin monoamine oxidase family protein n=1 Tax=Elioraea sp. TaxID=2185103 RepID=UPI0025C5CE23|nr:FAD-dependent oxidoreductase [Elioraea sp.]